MRRRARPPGGLASVVMCSHSRYVWELQWPLHFAGIRAKGVSFCNNFCTGGCSGGVCIQSQDWVRRGGDGELRKWTLNDLTGRYDKNKPSVESGIEQTAEQASMIPLQWISSANVFIITAKMDALAVLKATVCWRGEWQDRKKKKDCSCVKLFEKDSNSRLLSVIVVPIWCCD